MLYTTRARPLNLSRQLQVSNDNEILLPKGKIDGVDLMQLQLKVWEYYASKADVDIKGQ